jgi:hypothetical protein
LTYKLFSGAKVLWPADVPDDILTTSIEET